jgi:hypothetical protein
MKAWTNNRSVWLVIGLLAGVVLGGIGALLTDAEICYVTKQPPREWTIGRTPIFAYDTADGSPISGEAINLGPICVVRMNHLPRRPGRRWGSRWVGP